MMTETPTPEIKRAIADYFETRTRGPWAISTGQAMRRIREMVPQAAISDDDLVHAIADAAIARGLNISFDSSDAA